MESLAMSEASIKRTHIGASGREDTPTDVVVHAAIINSVDTAQLNKVRHGCSSPQHFISNTRMLAPTS